MPGDRSSFGREDALLCADVLGGFGVASDHVRELVDPSGDLEVALQDALADAAHPAAFVEETVAAAPRGVDAPAEFWTTAPETQLGDVFAALDWTFDVRSANGRSLAVDDEQPYRLRVEDADGRTRSTDFSFPETPLGAENYPALVHAVNEDLLFGLDCQLVQLSDGSERWRFALVETDELDRLRERFGDAVEVFGRALLATDQPGAYAPAESDGAGGEDDVGGVPVPDWAAPSDDQAGAGNAWADRELTAASFDADHVGGLAHLSDTDSGSTDQPSSATSEASSAVAEDSWGGDDRTDPPRGSTSSGGAIEFVDRDGDAGGSTGSTAAPRSRDTDPASTSSGQSTRTTGRSSTHAGLRGELEPAETVEIRDADVEADEAHGRDADGDLEGWSIGGTVDATTRTSNTGTESPDTQAETSGSTRSDPRSTSASTRSGPRSTSSSTRADSRSTSASTAGSDAVDDESSGDGFEWGPDDSGGRSSASARSRPPDSAGTARSSESAARSRPSDSAGASGSSESAARSRPSESFGSSTARKRSTEQSSSDTGGVGTGAVTDSASVDGPSRESSDEPAETDDDGFFSADAVSSFDAGATARRVEPDSFGVDAAEQTADDEFAAVGAAIAAPARISVGGLLDDDEFLPEIPRVEPAEVRIEFEDEFDPNASESATERETDDGFVWVNESDGLSEDRTATTD